MKAGIYKLRNNGNLVYIAKDRSIRAYAENDEVVATEEAYRKEFRVTARNKDTTVEFEDGRIADRVADVPNGCTDPAKALADTLRGMRAATPAASERGEVLQQVQSSDGVGKTAPAPLAALSAALRQQTGAASRVLIVGSSIEPKLPEMLRQEGYRFCHSRSARKHLRRNHEVIYAPQIGMHAWRKTA